MKFNRFIMGIAAGSLLLTSIGCASSKKTVMSDQEIANQIKTQLEAPTGPQGPFVIDIFSDKGKVTLDGTVPTASAKEEAMDVAHTTQGVKDVASFLSVR